MVPNVKFDVIKTLPDVLTVEIVQPKKPVPVPVAVVVPEPPKPEVARPVEKLKPAPEPIKPKPIKPAPKDWPKPQSKPVQESKPQPVQAEPPPIPAVITTAPKTESPATFIAPTPEPPKEKPDNDDAYNAAKGSYRSSVQKEIQRNLRYPKMAQKHHVSGVAKVEIVLDAEGNISTVSVVSSSGNDSLDAEAVAVINRSDLKQYMNKMLKGKIDRIIIPVSFTLPDE